MAIAIAGTHSGVGKTTITLAILATLNHWGLKIQSFKVGPDYIDPMFHSAITGRPCRNLDPVITSPAYVQSCFVRHSTNAEAVVIEGVMGLFDGAGSTEFASTAHVVKLLKAVSEPVSLILVVDCAKLSRSLAATIYGYQHFDPDLQIAGLILNRVGSDRHREILLEAIAPLGIPVLGIVPKEEGIKLSDRHLGLVPTDEITNFAQITEQFINIGKTYFDWEMLLPLVKQFQILEGGQRSAVSGQPEKAESRKLIAESFIPHPRIAIARDRAFNFYYADTLEALTAMGAELINWSPLSDSQLPEHIQGLYFGGGFPEMFAAELAENLGAIAAVRAHAHLPIYAECGGLMYLSASITNFANHQFLMVGLLPTQTIMTTKLTLGYRCCHVLQNHLWLPCNQPIWGHEFHRSSQTVGATNPLYRLTNYADTNMGKEGWSSEHLVASYVHLHWGYNLAIAKQFLKSCGKSMMIQ